MTAFLAKGSKGNPVQHEKVNSKLAQSETQLQNFFDKSPDLLCIIQPDGTFGQLNLAWQTLLGWTPEALQTCYWIELVHLEDVEASLKVMQQARDGEACSIDNRYRHKDGSYQWLSWSFSANEDGYWYAIAKCCGVSVMRSAAASAGCDAFGGSRSRSVSNRSDPRTQSEPLDSAQIATEAIEHKPTQTTFEQYFSSKPTQQNRLSHPHLLAEIDEQLPVEIGLDSLFKFSLDLLCIAGTDGYFKRVNPAFETTLGYTAEEILAIPFLELVHPDDQAATVAEVQKLAIGIPTTDFENRYRCKNGSYRWLAWTSTSLPSKGWLYGVARDVTDRKQMETDITERKQAESAVQKNAEMLRFLLEQTPAAIAIFDKDMKFQLVSRRFLEDYNLCEQDIIGKSQYEVLPEMPDRWKEIHQRFLQGAVEWCDEDLFVRANGEQQWVKWEIRSWTWGAGESSGLILCAEVITEYKKAKERLIRLNKKLLHSNRDLEQFAYVASHDLQEPLRAVTSYAQLLRRKYQGNLDAKGDKYITYIVEGTTRMQQLINDLLEFSRVGTHSKDREPIACETVLSKVLDNLKVAIAESNAFITHDPLPIVVGDETQLIQLFQNLIGNAIKFRREEPPRVHISAVQQENEWAFEISDSGIGMEPEYFERIFTIFQRLHSSRKKYPGTGIGLAVCKKIVERHGGRIWVESTLGVGTTFHFTVPQKRQ